jgi:Holliday junction resolvase-like predicted endonuclease
MKELKESQKETDRIQKETEKKMNETFARIDKRFEKMQKMTGGISMEYGSFAEQYFFNSFDKGQKNFFGEKFDEIDSNCKGIGPGEYDIMMINGKSVAVIEVKFKARQKYLDEMLKKAVTFKKNFPQYRSHKLYLGLAAMVIELVEIWYSTTTSYSNAKLKELPLSNRWVILM